MRLVCLWALLRFSRFWCYSSGCFNRQILSLMGLARVLLLRSRSRLSLLLLSYSTLVGSRKPVCHLSSLEALRIGLLLACSIKGYSLRYCKEDKFVRTDLRSTTCPTRFLESLRLEKKKTKKCKIHCSIFYICSVLWYCPS